MKKELIAVSILGALTASCGGESKGFPVSINGKTDHNLNLNVPQLNAISKLIGGKTKLLDEPKTKRLGKKKENYDGTNDPEIEFASYVGDTVTTVDMQHETQDIIYNNNKYKAHYLVNKSSCVIKALIIKNERGKDVTNDITNDELTALDNILYQRCIAENGYRIQPMIESPQL